MSLVCKMVCREACSLCVAGTSWSRVATCFLAYFTLLRRPVPRDDGRAQARAERRGSQRQHATHRPGGATPKPHATPNPNPNPNPSPKNPKHSPRARVDGPLIPPFGFGPNRTILLGAAQRPSTTTTALSSPGGSRPSRTRRRARRTSSSSWSGPGCEQRLFTPPPVNRTSSSSCLSGS